MSSNQLCSCTNQLTERQSCCKLRFTPWNCTCQRSNWGSFPRSIKRWGQISCAAVQISWQKGKIAVNWDLHHGIAHIKGQIGVVFQGQSSGEVKSAVQLYKWWMMRFWRTDGTQLFKSRELSPTMTSEWILQTIDFFLLDIIPVLKSIKEWRLETDF